MTNNNKRTFACHLPSNAYGKEHFTNVLSPQLITGLAEIQQGYDDIDLTTIICRKQIQYARRNRNILRMKSNKEVFMNSMCCKILHATSSVNTDMVRKLVMSIKSKDLQDCLWTVDQ